MGHTCTRSPSWPRSEPASHGTTRKRPRPRGAIRDVSRGSSPMAGSCTAATTVYRYQSPPKCAAYNFSLLRWSSAARKGQAGRHGWARRRVSAEGRGRVSPAAIEGIRLLPTRRTIEKLDVVLENHQKKD